MIAPQLKSKESLPCPHCAAGNITCRATCWQCGQSLPFIKGANGALRENPDPAAHKYTDAEIQQLLDSAQTFNLEHARKSAPALKKPGRTWFWRQRRKTA